MATSWSAVKNGILQTKQRQHINIQGDFGSRLPPRLRQASRLRGFEAVRLASPNTSADSLPTVFSTKLESILGSLGIHFRTLRSSFGALGSHFGALMGHFWTLDIHIGHFGLILG